MFLGDFGFSNKIGEKFEPCWSIYRAPDEIPEEYLQIEPFTLAIIKEKIDNEIFAFPKLDIFPLGVMLYEFISNCQFPQIDFHDFKKNETTIMDVIDKLSPPKTPSDKLKCELLRMALYWMLPLKAETRASAQAIVDFLESLKRKFQ